MTDRGTDSFSSPRVSSVVFDYGVDMEACADDAVAISDRGMRLRSHWQFEIGTQLSIALVRPHPELGTEKITIEAMVVWCERKEERCYESTMLFLELPEECKQHLREFSFPPDAQV